MSLNRWLLIGLILVSLLVLVGSAFWNEPPSRWSAWAEEWGSRRGQGAPGFGGWGESEAQLIAWRSPLSLLAHFLTGILLLLVFPQRIRRLEARLAAPPAELARIGLFGLLAGGLLLIAVMSAGLTMLTFPLAVILGVTLFLSIFFGFTGLAYALGHLLVRRAGWGYLSPVYALLAGLLTLFALGELPYAGVLFQIAFAGLSLGAVALTGFGSGRAWNFEPLMEEYNE